MLVLVTYDVNTENKEGRRRLRKVALACKDYGQRVQFSVFECVVSDAELVRLRARLVKLIDNGKDNLRIYLLDEAARKRVEHYGISRSVDFEGSLQV
ncbi:MAG: CRISPR-associated endonuclease Cas2 [Candidatus Coatesbacteria bacterium]